MKRKITKLVKQSKIITQQSPFFENPSIVDIKSDTIEYPKTSGILSKTIRQTEKDSKVDGAGKTSDSPLCSEIKQSKNFLDEKKKK